MVAREELNFQFLKKISFWNSQCLTSNDTGRDLETDPGRAIGLGPGKDHVIDDQGMTEIKIEGDATFTARIPGMVFTVIFEGLDNIRV